MAQPQTEALIRSLIAEEGAAQGWTPDEVQGTIDHFIAIATAAEAGDVAAQQEITALFAASGQPPPSFAHTVPPLPPRPTTLTTPFAAPGELPTTADVERRSPAPAGMSWRETGQPGVYQLWSDPDVDPQTGIIFEAARPVGNAVDLRPEVPELTARETLEGNIGRDLTPEEAERQFLKGGTSTQSKLDQLQAYEAVYGQLPEDVALRFLLGFSVGAGGAQSLTPFQAGQLDISRGNLAVSQRAQERSELEAQIQAARTAQPIAWLSLLRGIAPGAGGTEVTRGRPRIAPTLSQVSTPAPTPRLSAPAAVPAVVDPVASTAQRRVTAPTSRVLGEPQPPGIPIGDPRNVSGVTPTLRAPTRLPTTGTGAAAAGTTGATALTASDVWDPVTPFPASETIAAGRELLPAGLPPGIRLPGLQAQARMDPFEVAAFEEEVANRGVPPMSLQWNLARLRAGTGPAPATRPFGGRLRAPRV